MKDVIDSLKREAKYHRDEATKRENAIKALQAVCEHKMEPDGHDSHYSYETCSICGKTERC